ncbi:helix-turn-helix transcriptional regulator [Methylobacterium sp. JK268]
MTIVRTKTPAGEPIVILPEAEFERLRVLAEEAEDGRIVAASQARLDSGEDELLTGADLDALRTAPSALAFWRARRGIALAALSEAVGVSAERLQTIERGEDTADIHLSAKLARELGIDIEDLAPPRP